MPKMLYVTEEMIARAGKIGMNAEEIRTSQNKVAGIFQNLGRNFSGRIPSLMTEKIIAMENEFQAMNNNLLAYKTFLEDTAREVEWTDEEASRWMRELGRK